ncbi:MAG: NACHT domain-containing protein, partial [Leptolyngbya sp.]|nr:NACHT domain-containing protein [Leptolyngbya sp.]
MTPSSPPPTPPPLNERLADWLLKTIMAGGLAGGSAGAFWSLFKDDDVQKAIASFVIGVGISYGAKLLMPIHKGNQRRLDSAGQALDRGLDRLNEAAIAKITAVEDRYFACQAAECETYRTEGVGKRSGIFTPLLDQVFVPLELDRSARSPGFCESLDGLDPSTLTEPDALALATVDIWQLLARAHQGPVYSQIAILAWGGYGKTTLLRHVAYTLGKNRQPQSVPRYLPVLLLLRKYRDLLSQDQPPALPDLIVQHHVPSLPVATGLRMTTDWVADKLRRGQVLVMLDGFDEVPKSQRPQVARWLNAQMRAYRQAAFIVTARPKAYTEQTGADRLDLNTLLWVRDFSPSQRQAFIHKWYWCQEYYHHGKEDIPAVRQAADTAAA